MLTRYTKKIQYKLQKRITNFDTWNAQGVSNKINEVIHKLLRLKIELAVLTETKKKVQGSENLGQFYIKL